MEERMAAKHASLKPVKTPEMHSGFLLFFSLNPYLLHHLHSPSELEDPQQANL